MKAVVETVILAVFFGGIAFGLAFLFALFREMWR
jgi:hypothetical protein